METVFTCKGLRKKYKTATALDGVDLTLQKGHVYGLVGNNGAGKTTLMRVIMGLSFPDAGEMSLLGETTEKGLIHARRKVGAFIEMPIYDGLLSGKQNLQIICALYGVKDPEMPDRMLQKMGIADKGKQPVRYYSLGQRQRLGLAEAFAISPEFLILDEPLNGLDPSGAKEIRELLLKLYQEEKTTILISSHNLAQLRLLATDYIILHHGKVIEEITGTVLEERCKGYLSLKVVQGQEIAAEKALKEKIEELELEIMGQGELSLRNYTGNEQKLYTILSNARVEVLSLKQEGLSLEDYFTRLVGGKDL